MQTRHTKIMCEIGVIKEALPALQPDQRRGALRARAPPLEGAVLCKPKLICKEMNAGAQLTFSFSAVKGVVHI